jgi:hypothetical protein
MDEDLVGAFKGGRNNEASTAGIKGGSELRLRIGGSGLRGRKVLLAVVMDLNGWECGSRDIRRRGKLSRLSDLRSGMGVGM